MLKVNDVHEVKCTSVLYTAGVEAIKIIKVGSFSCKATVVRGKCVGNTVTIPNATVGRKLLQPKLYSGQKVIFAGKVYTIESANDDTIVVKFGMFPMTLPTHAVHPLKGVNDLV